MFCLLIGGKLKNQLSWHVVKEERSPPIANPRAHLCDGTPPQLELVQTKNYQLATAGILAHPLTSYACQKTLRLRGYGI